MDLYLSLSVYACSCLFLSVAVCFLRFLFVFICWESNISFQVFLLLIIWIMINASSAHNISSMYSLHFLYNSTRVTWSSALSGHPSSSFFCSELNMVLTWCNSFTLYWGFIEGTYQVFSVSCIDSLNIVGSLKDNFQVLVRKGSILTILARSCGYPCLVFGWSEHFWRGWHTGMPRQ